MKQNTFFIRQTIGKNIREGRKRLGLTQEQLSEAVELSAQSLSALENGAQFARMETYCRIAGALGITLYALLMPQPLDGGLDEQLKYLFLDCEADEKQALLNIMAVIKRYLRIKRQ